MATMGGSTGQTVGPSVPDEQAWQRAADEVAKRLATTSGVSRDIPLQVMRVNQIDAARLDVEMTAMLREQLVKVFSLVQPGLLSRLEPEVDAVLACLVWWFSIRVDRPTPGNALMNLRYRDEREFDKLARMGRVRTGLEGSGLTLGQKVLFLFGSVGCHYLWVRMNDLAASQRWADNEAGSLRRRLWVGLQRADGLHRVASLGNLLCFLATGRYKSLLERLLRMRLVYQRANMSRAVSFEYMNRQLVWHEFSELLLLVLPLLNLGSIRRALLSPFAALTGMEGPRAEDSPEDSCPVCQARPIVVPFVALPCGHLFCYYCLRTRTLGDRAFKCPRCRRGVEAMRRHHPLAHAGAAADKAGEGQDAQG